MARSINFQYIYPYNLWDEASRYYVYYDENRTTLSGNYTYPLSFMKNYPYIVRARIVIRADNSSGTNILNRNWYFYVYTGSWRNIATFTMPESGTNGDGKLYGEYTWEGNIGYTVQKIAAVPTSTLSTSTEWFLGVTIEEMTVRETVTTTDLTTNNYFTAFPNYAGVAKRPTRIYANVGGTLTAATKVLTNIGGTLVEMPTVYSGEYTTTVPESFRLYEFTPTATGTYRILVSRKSGDHEARLYNSSFADLNNGTYFYDGSFSLTGGSVYYIMLTHYYTNTETADSVIFITKT